MSEPLIGELTAAVRQAQNNTHLRYAAHIKGRVRGPCPYCNDAALATARMSIVQVDLPAIFLMVDDAVWHCMRRFGWFDNQHENRTGHQRFMGVPVVLAPYTRGWKVCRGA